jgi:predicted Zn finger-like uncharacterized protein
LVVTQCPECHALFRVSDGQMRLAQGQVRCGACLTVFDAHSHSLQRVDSAQQSTPAPQAAPQLSPAASAPVESSPGSYATQGSNARVVQFKATPEPQSEATQPKVDPALIPQIDINAEPIVLHNNEPQEANPVAVLFWTLCSLIAFAALIGQYLWFERATLAHQPALAPYYQIACERLRCDLNANQGLANLEPDQVVVRPHQQFTDLISLAIRIRNEAAFAQPYPAIEVSFTDLKGNLVSRRTFQPGQYLGTNVDGPARLPAGLDIEVTLPLTTPGPEAVSYEIRLHQAKS